MRGLVPAKGAKRAVAGAASVARGHALVTAQRWMATTNADPWAQQRHWAFSDAKASILDSFVASLAERVA